MQMLADQSTDITMQSLHFMQARDSRFSNASVEFNQQTLRPTYRLVWGEAGASHALAVAEGLKFDPSVIADARSLMEAGEASVELGKEGKNAQAMQVGA